MQDQPLTHADLLSFFVKDQDHSEKIGVEVELGVVDPETGISLPYEGSNGVQAILEAFLGEEDWQPIYDEDLLIGLTRADGTQLVLESGGQIEYASPPATNLIDLITTLRQVVLRVAEVSETLGAALIAGSLLPFDRREDAKYLLKPRYQITLDYLNSLGSDFLGWAVMARTISTQVTFDYGSELDMRRKMRALVAAVPVSYALFANSPIEAGVLNGVLSNRLKYWLKFDPARCGCLNAALQDEMTFEDYVNWAIEVPVIAAVINGVCQPMQGRAFATLLEQGFGDGSYPTMKHWQAHFSSIYTDIRLRRTIEIRSIDGQNFDRIPATCAFWTGLVYSPAALDALWNLLQDHTAAEYTVALAEVCHKGLKARYGKDSIQALAIEMVNLAKQGLEARIQAGLERPEVLAYLEPIEAVAISGKTSAEELIERWQSDLQHSPAQYVNAYRVR